MENPLISIIVPIYNIEKYFKQCVSSLLLQSLENIEIILINDGSLDNCPAMCDAYAAQDKRIKVIHQQNGGYGKACNAGMKEAAGKYFAILEPDDFIASDMYKKLYELAVEHDADIVKSSFYENFDTPHYKKVKKVYWYDNTFSNFVMPDKVFTIYDHPEFLYYHPSVWSCIYRREFIVKHNIRFIEASGASWTDNPFQVQTMCLAQKIFYTDEAFYYWRRINVDESKDLKDYTVPFKRSDEIHEWLANYKIKNENLFACLYKREYIYIHVVLGMLTSRTLADGLTLIKMMLNRMDANIIRDNKYITERERLKITILKIFPQVLFLYLKLKKRKELFTFGK